MAFNVGPAFQKHESVLWETTVVPATAEFLEFIGLSKPALGTKLTWAVDGIKRWYTVGSRVADDLQHFEMTVRKEPAVGAVTFYFQFHSF